MLKKSSVKHVRKWKPSKKWSLKWIWLIIVMVLSVLAIITYANKYMIDKQSAGQSQSVVRSVYSDVLNAPTPVTNTIQSTIIPTSTPTPVITPIAIVTSHPSVSLTSRGGDYRAIEPTKSTNNTSNTGFKYVNTFIGSITMYTLDPSECGKSPSDPEYGITASGEYVKEHRTIAMARGIPFGSKVKIEGFDEIFTVTDRGGAIVNLCVDVYTSSRKEAFAFGRQKRRVWILSYGNGKLK